MFYILTCFIIPRFGASGGVVGVVIMYPKKILPRKLNVTNLTVQLLLSKRNRALWPKMYNVNDDVADVSDVFLDCLPIHRSVHLTLMTKLKTNSRDLRSKKILHEPL